MTRSRTVAAALAATVAVLTASGCGRTGAEPGTGADQVAFVPSVQGDPYFEAMNSGGTSAGRVIGELRWLYRGPTSADAIAQARIVRSFVHRRVSAIAVAPADPDVLGPALDEAKSQGIQVLTTGTDAPGWVRDAFVSPASAAQLGRSLTDSLLTAMGGRGAYAIVSCGAAAELDARIAVQRSYTAERYPAARIVDVRHAGRDATRVASGLLSAHPELTGLVGECPSAAPAVAQAVRDAGKVGRVFTVGVGTPTAMRPYLADGSASASVLWDVEQLGYLTAWAGYQLAKGRHFQPVNHVSDALPSVRWDAATRTLLLGDPLILTRHNAGRYPY
jgi:rhamnose transport system substrate-binding protein